MKDKKTDRKYQAPRLTSYSYKELLERVGPGLACRAFARKSNPSQESDPQK